jgi:hypothetical protein
VTDKIWPSRMHRPDASAYLREVHGIKAAVGTLAKLACLGDGPPFSYAGRFPIYTPPGLDDWAAKKLTKSVRSTSEGKVLRAQLQQAVAA